MKKILLILLAVVLLVAAYVAFFNTKLITRDNNLGLVNTSVLGKESGHLVNNIQGECGLIKNSLLQGCCNGLIFTKKTQQCCKVCSEISGYIFLRDLTVGSSGSDVSELQQFLINKGFLVMPPSAALGYFGALTQAALAKYQGANNLSPANGYFGPVTREFINNLLKVSDCKSVISPINQCPSYEDVGNIQDYTYTGSLDLDFDSEDAGNSDVIINIDNISDFTDNRFANVPMYSFSATAKNGDISLDNIKFYLARTKATETSLSNMFLSPAVKNSKIWISNSQTVYAWENNLGENSGDIYFNDLNLVIKNGESLEFTFYPALNPVTAKSSEGLKVTGVDVGYIGAEDSTLISQELNDVEGGEISFIETLPKILTSYVSESFSDEKPADGLDGTIKIVFDVTAIGEDIKLNQNGSEINSVLKGAIQKGKVISVKGEITENGFFTVKDGETDRITLSVKFASSTSFVKLVVTDILGIEQTELSTDSY